MGIGSWELGVGSWELGVELVAVVRDRSIARMSPGSVSELASAPAGSSITAYTRRANAIRHAGKAAYTFTTRPSRATKATSIGNFMKQV